MPMHSLLRIYSLICMVFAGRVNMVMESPYQPVRQTIFYLRPSFDNMVVRINHSLSTHDALSKIAAIFKKYSPSVPFTYKFVDEDYETKFNDEERVGKLASVFAILAILISCFGLFGMASFMAEQRIKEIGVRKVLGASVFNLWGLLSKEFVMMVLINQFILVDLCRCRSWRFADHIGHG